MEEKTNQPSSNVTTPNVPSAPSQTPSPSAPPKKSKLIYLFIALLVLLILTVGATSAVFISKSMKPKPTPTPIVKTPSPTPPPAGGPTASWKTYTNSKYGFSFKYPLGFATQTDTFETQTLAINNNSCQSNNTIDLFAVNYKSLVYNSIEQYEKAYSKILYKEVLFRGEKAVELQGSGSPQTGGPTTSIFVIHNNAPYEIFYRFCAPPGTVLDSQQLVNLKPNILSTFKFTTLQDNSTTGIEGHMSLGPTCPVQSPGANCEKDYQGTVIVKSADGTTEITRFISDVSGNFKISLPIGTYLLVPQVPSSGYPSAKTQTVTVESGSFTRISVLYDTGIR